MTAIHSANCNVLNTVELSSPLVVVVVMVVVMVGRWWDMVVDVNLRGNHQQHVHPPRKYIDLPLLPQRLQSLFLTICHTAWPRRDFHAAFPHYDQRTDDFVA